MDPESQRVLGAFAFTLLGGLIFGALPYLESLVMTLFRTRMSLYESSGSGRRRSLLAAANAVQSGVLGRAGLARARQDNNPAAWRPAAAAARKYQGSSFNPRPIVDRVTGLAASASGKPRSDT